MKNVHQYFANIFCFCILLVCTFLFPSCKKFIRPLPPADEILASDAFATDAGATAAVIGIYKQLPSNSRPFSSFGIGNYAGLSADELSYTKTSASIREFQQNALTATNGDLLQVWRNAYKLVYSANACIEGLASAKTLTPDVKSQLTGEVKFFRAFCYFYLVNLYGDVPLVRTTNYKENASLQRTPSTEVYEAIVQDLTDAIQLLKQDYVTSGRARPNQYAARTLLSRVFLYRQEWEKAEAEASLVISSGLYSLPSDPASVFLKSSSETIWQISSEGLSFNTPEGNQYIPSSSTAIPTYSVTSFALDAFEPGDKRETAWIGVNNVRGDEYHYPAKYKIRTGTSDIENSVYLRLAELYLIRSEARLRQDKFTEAREDLDIIRIRAGLAGTTAASRDELMTAIAHERQVEFLCEWGHRWLDLRRWGIVNDVLSAEKTGWQPTDALYPIPFNEIQLNPSLTQNPGY